jgi:hypothetical protein
LKPLLALAVVALLGAAGPAVSGAPKPVIERAKGEQCIEAPEVMRREHMTMLKHQRDDTVHGGVRSDVGRKSASLLGCVECHASAKTGSVAAAPGDFCVSCHSYTAVKIDCFECHATRPKAAAQAGGQK